MAASSKPMSVKEIASKAQDFDFDLNIALKYWFRTADALIKEVIDILELVLLPLLTTLPGTHIRARKK